MQSVPEDASVCPHAECGRPLGAPLPPPVSLAGRASAPPEAPPVQWPPIAARGPSPPEGRSGVSRRTFLSRSPRSRRNLLGLALLCLVLLAGTGWWGVVRNAGRGSATDAAGPEQDPLAAEYSELDPDAGIVLERSADDADRVSVVYCPTTPGTVTFALAGSDAHWSQTVASEEVGEDHVFALPSGAAKAGDTICVTYRRGGTLATQQLAVAEATQTESQGPVGLYARRTMAGREAWIARFGGNEASEQAVADALEWLARHQADDGSWSNRCLQPGQSDFRCEKAAPCSGPGGSYEMALTGLALLAFQAGGHYDFNGNRYSENVRRAIDWMIARQRPDGGLLGSKQARGLREFYPQFMYEHGIATFALADACAVDEAQRRSKNTRYTDALEQAVRFIDAMQHDDGGWRYTSDRRQPSDTSVTGWQVLALKSAREAGVSLNGEKLQKIRRFFEARATGEHGRTGYLDHGVPTEATTGVGMLARQFLLGEPDSPYVRDAAEYLAGYSTATWPDRVSQSARSDYYLWYNCTLAMFQAGGEPWKRWNGLVRDAIIGLQRREGCARGSWDPDGRWGSQGGRIYSTSLAALTLEVYYRYANVLEKPPADNEGSDTNYPLIRRK